MKRASFLLLGLVLAAGSVGLAPAQAGYPHAVVVSQNPDNWLPRVEDGMVRASATVGGITVAGGDFTSVTERRSTLYERRDLFAFDSSGDVSQTFVPHLGGSNPDVFSVVPAGDGRSVFIGGIFSSVNGVPRTNAVAKIDVRTGQVNPTFRSPGFGGARVHDVHLANGRLYVAGAFDTVAGSSRSHLVALDPVTGNDTGSVDLSFSETFNGGQVYVKRVVTTPDGSRLVAIGNFRRVDGQSRSQVAMVDISKAAATLDSWATDRYGSPCISRFQTYVTDVDTSPDGSYFVVVTTGGHFGGVQNGVLCDTIARWEVGRNGPGQQPTWIDYSGGDTFTAVAATGTAIYAGGHFRWLNNPFVSNRVGPGAVPRSGIAAVDPRNGLPFSWNPGRSRGPGVWGFTVDSQGLWVGHDRNVIGGEVIGRLALMPTGGGELPPADHTGSLPGNVYLLDEEGGSDRVVRRGFTGSEVTGDTDVSNGGLDWDAVRGSFMVDGVLYSGWSDGVLRARTYDGTRYGASEVVDLRGLTDFATDLRSVRMMFFDRASGRLYYTLAGNATLYYRYFTPESRVVGAVRHSVATTPDLALQRAGDGFLVGDRLYFQTDEGDLRVAHWDGSRPVPQTSSVVSGPGDDGVEWSSRAMFLYAG